MRVAQVAPLYESVPPRFYGGTERVVSYLTEEFVRLGHEVTLFASADSTTSATLVTACPKSLRLNQGQHDPVACHFIMFEQVLRRAGDFDVIHFHTDYLHFPFFRNSSACHVTTLHGRLDLPELSPLYKEFAELPVVSISDGQRKPVPWLNWKATVHHGLPVDHFTPQPRPGRYLAFLGRVSPEKRPDRAIRIAELFGAPLKIAAKVDKIDHDYHAQVVKPLLRHSLVEFVGEVDEVAKNEFLGNAYALLFPIDWPEPFGLVMIEAMACGTPVIAYPHGSVPEIVEHGVTGFIVNSEMEAAQALSWIPSLDRNRIREHFVQRFSVSRMVQDYLNVYETIQFDPVDLEESAA